MFHLIHSNNLKCQWLYLHWCNIIEVFMVSEMIFDICVCNQRCNELWQLWYKRRIFIVIRIEIIIIMLIDNENIILVQRFSYPFFQWNIKFYINLLHLCLRDVYDKTTKEKTIQMNLSNVHVNYSIQLNLKICGKEK